MCSFHSVAGLQYQGLLKGADVNVNSCSVRWSGPYNTRRNVSVVVRIYDENTFSAVVHKPDGLAHISCSLLQNR
ncbi:unnamed protein product [Caretta caretta]